MIIRGKVFSVVALVLLLTSVLTLAFNIQPAKAIGTIYIRADGSIDPPESPISTLDNITYTFTANITDSSIVVEKDSVVIDGAGYTLQGTGSGYGISFTGRSNVTLRNMEIKAFTYGVYAYSSPNNTISGNNVANNVYGIFSYSSNNSVSGNNITANNSYGVWLYGSSNNSLSGNNITNNGYGVRFDYSSNYNSVSENTIANNGYGVELFLSSNYNSISGNNITANNYHGVWLDSSNNNSISGNNITANNYHGVWLYGSSNNSLSGNTIANNNDGVGLYSSSNNIVYHNSFIDNAEQVYAYGSSASHWDNGYPSGGNYWSDYNGTDLRSGTYQNEPGSDGIGDTPYVIDASDQDDYPLIKPYGIQHDVGVTSITTTKTVVGQGYSLNASARIVNYGLNTEILNVTTFYGYCNWDASLVGCWSLDENSGTVAHDGSGNDNNGTIYGASWVDGKFGKALSFDGIDDHVAVNSSSSLSPLLDGSVEFWFKLARNVTAGDDQAFCLISVPGTFWTTPGAWTINVDSRTVIGDDAGKLHAGIYDGSSWHWVKSAQTSWLSDCWYHALWTFGSKGQTLFINGVNVSAEDYTGQASFADHDDMLIGMDRGNLFQYFNGTIDEIKIYNRTLSAQEAWAEYTQLGLPIQTQTVTLEGRASATITFTWNTTSFAYGNYTVSAVATLPSDTDPADNMFVDGKILVTITGDINGDQFVNAKDAVILGGAFGATRGDPTYSPNADTNSDDWCNAKDAVILGTHFGQHWP